MVCFREIFARFGEYYEKGRGKNQEKSCSSRVLFHESRERETALRQKEKAARRAALPETGYPTYS